MRHSAPASCSCTSPGDPTNWIAATRQKGFTLIPVRLYFRNGRVKCEIALAKGKQEYDKRATERKREADNEAKSAIARSQRS